MKETTQVYIVSEGKVLLLFRDRKKNDMNEGKWIAPGGRIEEGETASECAVREVLEETGILIDMPVKRAEILFLNTVFPSELMHVYTASSFVRKCEPVSDEGSLEWIEIGRIGELPMWEGDRYFVFDVLDESEFFRMTLEYDGYRLKDFKKY